MTDLSMAQLAAEYGRSADLVQRRLQVLQEEMKTARGKHYFDLQKRVELLRFELYDTRRVERMLHDYYC